MGPLANEFLRIPEYRCNWLYTDAFVDTVIMGLTFVRVGPRMWVTSALFSLGRTPQFLRVSMATNVTVHDARVTCQANFE